MVRVAAVLVLLAAVSGCAASPFAARRVTPIEVTRVAPAPRDEQVVLADYWRERRTATPYLQPAFAAPETPWSYRQKWKAEQERFLTDPLRADRKRQVAPSVLPPAVRR